MTTPKNFPGNKNNRRISAAERLEKEIERDSNILADSQNGFLYDFKALGEALIVKIQELKTLRERISKGGKKTTKKVGANVGKSW